MPTTDAQWAWFTFYTGGALLGWLLLPLAFSELWRK